MKKLIIVILSLAISKASLAAGDFNASCIESILKSASSSLRKNNKYLARHKALVSYSGSGAERFQEVHTDTGRAYTNTGENIFVCTKVTNNPQRSLSRKMSEIFEEVYKSQPTQNKNKFLAEVFSLCNRSDFSDLKSSISRVRNSVSVDKDLPGAGSLQDNN